jgi:tetratricopeptide (TPR) repeat protein
MNINLFVPMITMMFLVTSCGNQTKDVDKKHNNKLSNQVETHTKLHTDRKNGHVFVLNDMSVELMEKSLRYEKGSYVRDSLLNEALSYANAAIEIKEDFYYAYLNKANILKSLGKYDAALKTLEELLKVKEDYPEAIFIMGLIYEKTGNMNKAKQKYESALKAYEDYLKTPMATEQDKTNKDLVLLFIEGKEKALRRINEQIKENPENINLLINKQIIEQFNREEYFMDF